MKGQAYINLPLGLLPSTDHHASCSHSHRPHPERLVANQLPTMEQDIFREQPISRIGTTNVDALTSGADNVPNQPWLLISPHSLETVRLTAGRKQSDH